MKKGIVLSMCDRTGNMVKPWAEYGYECWCIDIQHKGDTQREGIRFIGTYIRSETFPGFATALFKANHQQIKHAGRSCHFSEKKYPSA